MWKQPKGLLINKWIKKKINTVDYDTAIKNDDIMPFATTWIDLEGITQVK